LRIAIPEGIKIVRADSIGIGVLSPSTPNLAPIGLELRLCLEIINNGDKHVIVAAVALRKHWLERIRTVPSIIGINRSRSLSHGTSRNGSRAPHGGKLIIAATNS